MKRQIIWLITVAVLIGTTTIAVGATASATPGARFLEASAHLVSQTTPGLLIDFVEVGVGQGPVRYRAFTQVANKYECWASLSDHTVVTSGTFYDFDGTGLSEPYPVDGNGRIAHTFSLRNTSEGTPLDLCPEGTSLSPFLAITYFNITLTDVTNDITVTFPDVVWPGSP